MVVPALARIAEKTPVSLQHLEAWVVQRSQVIRIVGGNQLCAFPRKEDNADRKLREKRQQISVCHGQGVTKVSVRTTLTNRKMPNDYYRSKR